MARFLRLYSVPLKPILAETWFVLPAHLGGGPKLVPDQAVVDKVNRPRDPAAVQVPVTQQRRQAVNQKKLVASAVENGMKMTGNEGPALDAEQVQRSRSRLTASPRKNPTPRQRMKHEANVPIQV